MRRPVASCLSRMPSAQPSFSITDSGSHLIVAAVILTMALAAVVGYRLMPKADVLLPLVDNCRLDQRPCASELPGGDRKSVV